MKMGILTALFGLIFQVNSQTEFATTIGTTPPYGSTMGQRPSTMGANGSTMQSIINSNSTIFKSNSTNFNSSMPTNFVPFNTSIPINSTTFNNPIPSNSTMNFNSSNSSPTVMRPMMMNYTTTPRPMSQSIYVTQVYEAPVKFGEVCKNNSMNPCLGLGLTCVDGVCACGAPDAIYNPEMIKCQRKIGAACKNGTTMDSYCSSGALCLKNVCTCPSGSKPIDEFTCTLPMHSQCKGKGQCNPSLSCIENKCRCGNVLSTINMGNECYSIEGGSCSAEGNKCLNNSECVSNFCRCMAGYVIDEEGNCVPTQGTACAIPKTTQQDSMMKIMPYYSQECKENSGLVCIEGTCECPDSASLIFNARLQKCELKIGANCEWKIFSRMTQTFPSLMWFNMTCESNGVCGIEEGKTYRTCKLY